MTPVSFLSAYRQLRPPEKVFVDRYVADVEQQAHRQHERISLALHRAIPADVIEASRGMLDRPMVRAAIAERINDIAAANELTPQKIVKEWMAIAFSNVGDYMEIGEDGTPWFDLAKCTPEQLAAIKSIKVEEAGGDGGLSRPKRRKFEFVLHDKIAGLQALMKYVGLDNADNGHYRAETARPVGPGALPASTTPEGAGDAYARMING